MAIPIHYQIICMTIVIFCLTFCFADENENVSSTIEDLTHTENAEHEPEALTSYGLFKFRWEELHYPMTITIWMLLAAYAKIIFHISKRVSDHLPDSALLIVMGLVLGSILYFLNVPGSDYQLDSHVFFVFLLPPIVFDAGYFMPSRAFFENLWSILAYAILGTLWNTFTIALGLYVCAQIGLFTSDIPILHILLFAALISAVDPVAVLCVFEEIHVNEVLHIVVFGESLLNDAITVVLYSIFNDFSQIQNNTGSISPLDVVTGVSSFFVVGLGGVLVGFVWAFLCSFTTRWTTHVKILNVLFVFLIPYLAYLSAELVGLSSIMAIVFCGLIMKPYVKENIGHNSRVALKYMIKMFSSSSEAVIFMFLGLSTIGSEHDWDFGFIIATLILCLLCRATGVLLITHFLNKNRIRKFSMVDHVIMAYGGLRGAVAYGLVVAIREDTVGTETRIKFITACEMVVLFTVFVQGTTIKPLVNLLKIEKAEHRVLSVNEQMFDRFVDHTLAGVEDIVGVHGHHWVREKFDYYNTKYVKPLLMRKNATTDDMKIVRSFHNLERAEALEVSREYKRIQSQNSIANFAQHYNLQPDGDESARKVDGLTLDQNGIENAAFNDSDTKRPGGVRFVLSGDDHDSEAEDTFHEEASKPKQSPKPALKSPKPKVNLPNLLELPNEKYGQEQFKRSMRELRSPYADDDDENTDRKQIGAIRSRRMTGGLPRRSELMAKAKEQRANMARRRAFSANYDEENEQKSTQNHHHHENGAGSMDDLDEIVCTPTIVITPTSGIETEIQKSNRTSSVSSA